jgi:hypothetical protein
LLAQACGLTRAFTEIGHGIFATATELNLLAIPVFLFGSRLAFELAHEAFVWRNWLCPFNDRHPLA